MKQTRKTIGKKVNETFFFSQKEKINKSLASLSNKKERGLKQNYK